MFKVKEYSCSERQQLGWRPPLQPEPVPIALLRAPSDKCLVPTKPQSLLRWGKPSSTSPPCLAQTHNYPKVTVAKMPIKSKSPSPSLENYQSICPKLHSRLKAKPGLESNLKCHFLLISIVFFLLCLYLIAKLRYALKQFTMKRLWTLWSRQDFYSW